MSVYAADGLVQVVGTLCDAEHLLVEKPLRPFLAVVHNLASLLEHIHMIGTQGDDTGARLVGHERHPPSCSIRSMVWTMLAGLYITP